MMRPLLLGHRGARARRQIPENTLASFELCLTHGCEGFEFDVRLSADGQAVICHDPDIGGFAIAKTKAKNLALPTLDDVLRQFAGRAFLDVELKVAGLEESICASSLKHPPQKKFVVSSFLPEVLTTIAEMEPTIPLGFLCESQNQLRGWHTSPAHWVIPRFDLVNEELIEDVHGAEKRIMVWTVNRPAQMSELAAWGVDSIISDETELLVQSLAQPHISF
jgi:glycerophosphoryl diester phosphodiesterase